MNVCWELNFIVSGSLLGEAEGVACTYLTLMTEVRLVSITKRSLVITIAVL